MKKWILFLTSGIVLILIAGGFWIWYLTQQPLYTPGMVQNQQNLSAPLSPPAQNGDSQFWSVEPGIKLHYFSQGSGRTVLIIHGGPGIPFSQPIAGIQPLSQRYHFYYYDQRGCGLSSRPIERFNSNNFYQNMLTLDKSLGLGAQIADIERIRQILGQDKLILVGHSFGGFLAALYAAEFPQHVQALVLVAPADVLVMPSADGGLYEEVKPFLPNEMKDGYAAYLKEYFDYGNIFSKSEGDLSALNDSFTPYYIQAANKKGFNVPAAEPQMTGGWMVQAMYFSMGQRHDYRQALKQVPAPVLVLHGDLDLMPESASRQYADAFPNASFSVIPKAGHLIFNDQPAVFNQVVGNFLDKNQ